MSVARRVEAGRKDRRWKTEEQGRLPARMLRRVEFSAARRGKRHAARVAWTYLSLSTRMIAAEGTVRLICTSQASWTG